MHLLVARSPVELLCLFVALQRQEEPGARLQEPQPVLDLPLGLRFVQHSQGLGEQPAGACRAEGAGGRVRGLYGGRRVDRRAGCGRVRGLYRWRAGGREGRVRAGEGAAQGESGWMDGCWAVARNKQMRVEVAAGAKSGRCSELQPGV
jgi:hypothetical protein